jgi:adenylyltransferase/sulfurtransferase
MSLLPEEIQRYRRHLSLRGFGPGAQERLKASTVLVIGAGGLGCPALLYLAAAGVGRLVVMDDDRVDVSNLQRQILYTGADAGRPKAEAAAARLLALNPLIRIEPRAERLTRDNALARVADCDVVLDGTDNFATRYLVNDACVIAGKPLVYGAIHSFEGQLSVFNWRGGPTYRCLFPTPPPADAVPNCAEAGVLGVLPGLIGTAQAAEVIKLLTGIGTPLSGRILVWNALTMETRSLRLRPVPANLTLRELGAEGPAACRIQESTTASGPGARSPAGDPRELSCAELRALLSKAPPPQLIDVREGWERSEGALPGSVHAPLASLGTAEAGALLGGLDPLAPTVVFCAGGVRSLKALPLLEGRHGFRQLRSLAGGYRAWTTLPTGTA